MIVFNASQRPMAPPSPEQSTTARPTSSRTTSFPSRPQSDDKDGLHPPKRAQTFHNGSPIEEQAKSSSAFEPDEDSDADQEIEASRASIELDVLPIELVSLTDSFIDSLGAKVHRTPPNIEKLSYLFQEFYAQASSHINIHISALATRQSRDASPAPSASSISSAASRLRGKATPLSAKEKPIPESEQQLITTEELAHRKQARRALEVKRHLLEEAVERRLCEGIYDRIYRHKSTQDEAQDDKLRSKTAALALVGIGPADLGVDLRQDTSLSPEAASEATKDIQERLAGARKDLVRMYESKYPLGKLNHLKAAHRSIVDTIAHFHPSASADEIMPMLIFTLITLPPENLHVISDIHFIQSFRWEPKLSGEAAYCLTNLEATISFLQTVDLATLRSDERPSGPPKSPKNQPGVLRTETFPPAYPQGLTPATTEATKENVQAVKPAASPAGLRPADGLRNRRLSDLVNTPAQAFGAASDAVFATADQGIKNVSTSLGDSYTFLVGKLRERQDSIRESINVPRTLDDARKLVSTPPPEEEAARSTAREERVLNMIGGRRDRSTDSTLSGRSASSSKLNQVLFPDEGKPPTQQQQQQATNPAMIDQMKSHLSSSFNPMARISNQIGMIRSFGRNVSSPVSTPPAHATSNVSSDAAKAAEGGDLGTAFPDIAAALPPKTTVPKISPPNKRFMELQNPGDLKLNEVLELLRDYRRLAGELKNRDAFEQK